MIRMEEVVKITGQSLKGRKRILNPVNNEMTESVLRAKNHVFIATANVKDIFAQSGI